MSSKREQHDEKQATANLHEIEKLVEAWASSKAGAKKLKATQELAKAAADFVDSEVVIEPHLLHQSVTL